MRTYFSLLALCTALSLSSLINLHAGAEAEKPSASGTHVDIKLPKDGTLAIETVRGPTWTTDREIAAKVEELKAKKDFDGLEALADKYRKSKAAYPTGIWYLNSVYNQIVATKDQRNKEYPALIEELNEWIKQKPKSPTPRVALVDAWINYAWEARGTGYADTVSKEGWRLYEERLKNAQAVVKDLDGLQAKDPQTYSLKLVLANALSFHHPEYNKIFDAAIKFEPTYMDYYRNKMVYLLPRWHGKQGEFEKFVGNQADKIGGKAGDIFYARMV